MELSVGQATPTAQVRQEIAVASFKQLDIYR